MKRRIEQNGWGLRAELLFVLLFLFCMVIVVVGLNRFGLLGYNPDSILEKTDDQTFDYEPLERSLISGAKEYISEYYSDGFNEDSIIVRYVTLRNYSYISKLVDGDKKECSGYVVVNNIEGNVLYNPYLKCKKYKTDGYDSTNDW